MDTNKIREIILKVNGKAAEENLLDLMKKVSDARAKIKELNDEIGDKSATEEQLKEFRKLRKEIDTNENKIRRYGSTADEVKRIMDQLSKSTLKELKQNLATLNKTLSSGEVKRGSEEWNQLTEAIKKTKDEIGKINQQSNNKGLESFGKNWVGVTTIASQAIGAYNAFTNMVDGYIDAYAKMDAAIRDVGKYTGLTDAELKALNEDLKQIDTATPREQLNALAADAGRLGITSREDILAFVEAADVINVALGEDLGEDAVKNIGKLAQMFGDDQTLGLKQAMLSTASTINELAQSSSASEGYLVDFTSRMAAMGKTAGMTQAQIMGIGAVMDQNMLGAETSATALSRAMQVLLNNTDKAARVAGVSTSEFSRILKEDANEALLLFAEGLQKLGGAKEQAAALKELDMTGQGIASTLQVLAQNSEAVRATQQQATETFRDGSSASAEFAKQQEKVEYKLQQAKNDANEAAIALGEALYPAYINVLDGASGLMGFLKSTVGFFSEYYHTFYAAAVIIALYTINLKLAKHELTLVTAAQKGLNFAVATGKSLIALMKAPFYALQLGYYALRGATDKATAAQMRFNSAIRKNPIGLIASLIALAIAYLWDYVEAAGEAAEAQEKMNSAADDTADIKKAASEEIQREQTRIQSLTAIIHDNTRSLEVRRRAIDDLKKIVPGYSAMIDEEGRITRENTSALEKYNEELILNATIRAQENKLVDLIRQKEDLIERKEQNRYAKIGAGVRKENAAAAIEQLYNSDDEYLKATGKLNELDEKKEYHLIKKVQQASDDLRRLEAEGNSIDNEMQIVDQRIANLKNRATGTAADMLEKIGTTETGGTSVGTYTGAGAGTGNDSDRRRRIRESEAQLAEQQREEEQAALAAYVADGERTYLDYLTEMVAIDNAYLEKRRKLYQDGDSEIANIDKQLADNKKKLGAQVVADSLKQVEAETSASLHELEMRRVRELMSDEDYNRERGAIEEQAARQRLEILEDNAADAKQIEDARQAYDDLRRKNQEDRELAHLRRVADFKKEYLKTDDAAKREFEENFAKALLAAKEIDDREFEQIMKLIKEKYESDEDKKETLDLGMPSDSLSSAFVRLGQNLGSLRDKLKEGKADWRDYAQVAVGALGTVSAMMQSATQLMQANMQAEQARVTERYDAEIQKAGENSTRGRKLEEQKQKELAKIKTKYAKKQMAMQIAAAIADTASNAIKAYGSVVEIPMIGPALAVAAAAAATAAGMIQIAVIKKQQEAQSAGYYEGGFTGGTDYRRQAGIVHQGEFVANHSAVANPALLPILRLIDSAQRTGTVASLTAEDVSRTIAAPVITAGAATTTARTASTVATTSRPATQPVIVSESRETAQTLQRLTDTLDRGIRATVSITGEDGIDRQWTRYQRMKGRR